MVKAGLAANGNITIPVETRAEGDTPTATTTNGILATVATQGKENVATDKLNILDVIGNFASTKNGKIEKPSNGKIQLPIHSCLDIKKAFVILGLQTKTDKRQNGRA